MTAAELETLAAQHGDEHTAQYKPTYYDQTDVELAYKAGFHKMLELVLADIDAASSYGAQEVEDLYAKWKPLLR